MKAKVLLFTSPTCRYCPSAKESVLEFEKTRDDVEVSVVDTHTQEGNERAKEYEILSVPTFIVVGPNYDPIGLRGNQTLETLNKYVDIALGKRSVEEKKGFISRLFS